MSEWLRIGQVADRTGMSVDAVRYYERRRLLPRPVRSSGGFRLFGPETIDRIAFIRQAQSLGFSLREIANLLAAGGVTECRQVRDLLRSKLSELEQRMRLMNHFRRVLIRHLNACERELQHKGGEAKCPALEEWTHRPRQESGPGNTKAMELTTGCCKSIMANREKKASRSIIILFSLLIPLLMITKPLMGDEVLKELKNLEEIRIQFNRDQGVVRIVLLLSPT
jgi:DNA-binding transcriptional MerR regulator